MFLFKNKIKLNYSAEETIWKSPQERSIKENRVWKKKWSNEEMENQNFSTLRSGSSKAKINNNNNNNMTQNLKQIKSQNHIKADKTQSSTYVLKEKWEFDLPSAALRLLRNMYLVI